MTYGIDTTFLIQLDVASHPSHDRARAFRDDLLDGGNDFALAPQVLAEYIHIVTDPRRFDPPVSTPVAVAQSRAWWHGAEVLRVFPDDETAVFFHTWMLEYSLGRKQILDTLLAATYRAAGITGIVSSNARDYHRFFEIVVGP